MKIRQLEYLMKIVECGSITQAAQQLYVSQPSLTKAISALEEEYGFSILVRKSRGVELTAQGRDFVHYARSVLTAVRALEKSSEEIKPPKTRLFISTQQLDFVYELVLRISRRFENKSLYFNLVETERNDVVQQVLDGRTDLGFAVRTEMDSKEFLWNTEARRLEIYTLAFGGIMVAVGPKSPLWEKDEVDMDDVNGYPLIALDLEEQAKQSMWVDDNYYKCFNQKRLMFCNTVQSCEYFLLYSAAVCFVSPWTSGCFSSPDIHMVKVRSDEKCNQLLWLKRAGEPLSVIESEFLAMAYRHFDREMPEKLRISSI